MTERLVISHIGQRGDGIVRHAQDGALFVPYALPGETVTVASVHGHPDRRSLMSLERESAERIAPICPHFGACGGCAMQHWQAQPYAVWKRDLVIAALRQVGLEAPVDDLIDAHGEGRRRAVFHARRRADDVIEVGFAAQRSHHIVAIDRCPVLAPGLAGSLEAAWAIAKALMRSGKPLDIQATASDAGLDIDVRGSGPLASDAIGRLVGIASERRLARLTRHGELVAQHAVPTIRMGRANVPVPPGVFLQATALGEDTLARLVIEQVGRRKPVVDLFAGVGPFTLRLAQTTPVRAVDNLEPALHALSKGALGTAGLKPITTEVRDLFRRPLRVSELSAYQAAVFDPPRQGAQAQAEQLARSSLSVVVGVSCNPTTFARDARILIDGGYRLERVTPLDQFRYTPHVELVGQFVR